jgi:hypothetical protein
VSKQRGQRVRWPVALLAALIGLVAISGGGLAGAALLEEHDTFCTSCHLAPEITYYNRAYLSLDHRQVPIHDLATAHYRVAEPFRCIACHRGDASLGHRAATLWLAGSDVLTYLAGRDDQTIEKGRVRAGWLPNAACVSCHAETLLRLAGLENHFHTYLPQAAQALARGGTLTVAADFPGDHAALLAQGLDPIEAGSGGEFEIGCISCHLGHKTVPGGMTEAFIDAEANSRACVACHVAAGRGPQQVDLLGAR